MATTLDTTLANVYNESFETTSVFTKFITWCTAQNTNRLLWLSVILAAHGCIITPLTIMAVFLTGNHFVLFMIAMVAMAVALVSNLAAMPTKYTLPLFFLSLLIDLGVLIAAFVM